MSSAGDARPPGVPERLGDFRLLDRLGAGGMGVVYLARQESLARDVALKLILPEHLHFAEARERFRREVEAAAKLRHPGIVPIYTVGEEGGLPYFAMELIEGASLADVLENLRDRKPNELSGEDLRAAILSRARRFGNSPTSSGHFGTIFEGTWVQACCRIALQVAEALQHAHERGVLHRDVKPSNIVISPSGRAMLLDFGLASTAESSRITRTGVHMGSLPYMPPENLRGGTRAADPRADVYSLGVSLYELLALALPFDAPAIQLLMAAISAGDPPPLRQRNASVPWDVAVVCATAMEREVERRYPTAEALARDLRNMLELRPIEARPPTRILRARRWVQRHPTSSVAALLGFLLIAVAPSVGWWRIRKERDVALRELQAKEAMLSFLLDLFEAADPGQSNLGQVTVAQMVDRGARLIEKEFRDLPEVRGPLLYDLAVMQSKLGRPREALALAREALDVLRSVQGDESRLTLKAKRAVGVQLLLLGEVEEGQRVLAEVRATVERLGGVEGIDLADMQMDSAVTLLLQSQPEEAQRILTELDSDPGWQRTARPEDRITWHTNMGQVLRLRGDPDGSAEHFARSLELARSTYGAIHVEVARSLQNLAVARVDSGRFAEALPLLLEARDVRIQLGDRASMEDARLEFNLGHAYSKLDRQAESAEHFGRALELCRELAGDSAQTANAAAGMGLALYKAGEYEKAEAILREALELGHRYLPQQGIEGTGAPLWLARCLVARDRAGESVTLYETVLRYLEQGAASRPELSAKIEGELADALASLGRADEAELHRARQREFTERAAAAME